METGHNEGVRRPTTPVRARKATMTTDHRTDPRCSSCENVLVRPGATCHVCDHDMHFEGAVRTSPPLAMPTSPAFQAAANRADELAVG